MTTFNSTEIKKFAKEAGIKQWWNKKTAVLREELRNIHTVSTDAELDFILNGGKVTVCPDAPNQVERTGNETCAGHKIDHDQIKKIQESRKEAKKRKQGKKPRKVSKKKSEKKAAKAAKAPKDTSGLITLATICTELNVEPRIARRKLRNSDIAKPDAGWNWTEGDKAIDQVKALLK